MRLSTTALARLVPLLCLALVACGGSSSDEDSAQSTEESTPMKPEETVFGDLVEKKQEVPAAVEDATREHMDAARRAVDEAADGKSDEPAQ